MATQRVLALIVERASHARKCLRDNEAPPQSRGCAFLSTVSSTSMSGEHSTLAVLQDHIPRCPRSWYMGLSTCVKSSCLKRGLQRGRTRGSKSAVFGRELLDIDMGRWCGNTAWLNTSILLLMRRSSMLAQCPSNKRSPPTLGQSCTGSST
jgi:hypothetical protein